MKKIEGYVEITTIGEKTLADVKCICISHRHFVAQFKSIGNISTNFYCLQ